MADSDNTNTESSTASIDRRCSGSGTMSTEPVVQPQSSDFLSFLTILQVMAADLVPAVWERVLSACLFKGISSRINQTLLTKNHTLAFKCIEYSMEKKEKDRALKLMSNEVSVLAHPSIKGHPNVARLLGVCWDIDPNWDIDEDDNEENQIWPALVSEKTKHGSLWHFVRSPDGEKLSMDDRERLCQDIGNAILFMHSNYVKPHNVLMFQETDGSFTAKVTDFGWSTIQADSNESITVGKSTPWNAPEHDDMKGQSWTKDQAERLDIFSLGMLCLWLLFEPYLTSTALKQHGIPDQNVQNLDTTQPLEVLAELKDANKLFQFAEERLDFDINIAATRKAKWKAFFQASFNRDPSRRAIGDCGIFATQEPLNENSRGSLLTDLRQLGLAKFDLRSSLAALYDSDYRIRLYIARCLKQEQIQAELGTYDVDYRNNVNFQMAICYYLGFGVEKDDMKCAESLQGTQRTLAEIRDSIPRSKIHFEETLLSRLQESGHFNWMMEVEPFVQFKNKDCVEKYLLRDMSGLEACGLGKSKFGLMLARQIFHFYWLQKRWTPARQMLAKCIYISMAEFGPLHGETQSHLSYFAGILKNFGQTEQAAMLERLMLRYGILNHKIGPNHPLALIDMSNLASSYRLEKRWDEAEALDLRVYRIRKDQLGPEHSDTLLTLSNLATTYRGQGRLQRAEEIELEVIKLSTKHMGAEHVQTLITRSNLGATYLSQGLLDEALAQFEEVKKARSRILGPEHSSTLTVRSNIASTLRRKGRLNESEECFQNVTLGQLKSNPPDSSDELWQCVEIWLQIEGVQFEIETSDEFEVLFVQYLLARPAFVGVYQEAASHVEGGWARKMVRLPHDYNDARSDTVIAIFPKSPPSGLVEGEAGTDLYSSIIQAYTLALKYLG